MHHSLERPLLIATTSPNPSPPSSGNSSFNHRYYDSKRPLTPNFDLVPMSFASSQGCAGATQPPTIVWSRGCAGRATPVGTLLVFLEGGGAPATAAPGAAPPGDVADVRGTGSSTWGMLENWTGGRGDITTRRTCKSAGTRVSRGWSLRQEGTRVQRTGCVLVPPRGVRARENKKPLT